MRQQKTQEEKVKARQYQKKIRELRIAAGLCRWCGKNPPDQPSKECRECLNRNNQSGKNRRSQLKKAGICQICQRRPLTTGSSYRCRECKERTTDARYKRVLDLSLEQVVSLLQNQQGLCLLCDKRLHDKFTVDHCHTTGIVRGILCHVCNTRLGVYELLKANPRTEQYLARSLQHQRHPATANQCDCTAGDNVSES